MGIPNGKAANSPEVVANKIDELSAGDALVLKSDYFGRKENDEDEMQIFERAGKFWYKDRSGQTRRWLSVEQWSEFEEACAHNMKPGRIMALFNVDRNTMLSMIDKRYSDFLPDGTRYVATLDDCYAQFGSRNELEMFRQAKFMGTGVVETGNIVALKLYMKMAGVFNDDIKQENTELISAMDRAVEKIKAIGWIGSVTPTSINPEDEDVGDYVDPTLEYLQSYTTEDFE